MQKDTVETVALHQRYPDASHKDFSVGRVSCEIPKVRNPPDWGERTMSKPMFDPGFTQQVTGNLRRAINRDGTFNVRRRQSGWKEFHPYLHLINMSWIRFFITIFLAYFVVNMGFALLYLMLGPGALTGASTSTTSDRFLNSFFFSRGTTTLSDRRYTNGTLTDTTRLSGERDSPRHSISTTRETCFWTSTR